MLEISYGAPQNTPCVHWSYMLLGCLIFGLCEPSSCGVASYWACWLAGLALCEGGCQPLPHVLAAFHWWVGLDPSIADHGAYEVQGWCQPTSGWGPILAQLNVQSMKSWDWCQPAGEQITSGTKRLKGGLQNGACQCWCPCGRVSSREWSPRAPPSPGLTWLPRPSPGGAPG